ncbi:MAG: prolyl oligopeptidase family protein [Vulcanimicrobiota bacterium]
MIVASPPVTSPRPAAPPPTRQEPVVDNYHGTAVVDRFRWLEDGESDETKQWVEAQNAYSSNYLQSLPFRPRLTERLRQLLTIGGVGFPQTRENGQFFLRRDGNQNQAVLVKRDPAGAETVLVDPNGWSDQGIEAMDWHYISPKGTYVVYGRSTGGDEWSTLKVLDSATGEHLADEIPRTRAASLAWLPDESGFYYTRYPEPGSVPPGQENYNRHVFFHQLGTDPAQDPKVFGEGLDPQAWPNVSLSEDGRHLMLSISQGWTRNDVQVLDRETGEVKPLIVGKNAQFSGYVEGDSAYLMTDLDAPRKRLIKVDLNNPAEENWVELLPQQDGAVLESFATVGDHMYATYLKNAASEIQKFSLEGQPEGSLELPGIGSVGGLAEGNEGELLYSFSSFNRPTTIYRLDTETGETDTWAEVDAGINPEDFEVHQEWFRSIDGTRVPMFVAHKKGLELDGQHPTVLYGYGGFDVNMTPHFSKSTVQWLENGGVYAVANLRGGGEFGSEWHKDGMLDQKQNVFDDFISAGQYLIKHGYTKPDKLAAMGGSNGGLLVGAAVTQAPELFDSAICAVPLLDMLRYDQFGIAQLWVPEYGTSANETQFSYIKDYSPYQHVKNGVDYPATLFMSGARDSRTDPLHARKMAAEMQGGHTGPDPIMLRVEENAGHGAGKPIGKQIEAEADKWAFLYDQMEVNPTFVTPRKD